MKEKVLLKEVIDGREIPRKLVLTDGALTIETPCSKESDIVIPLQNIVHIEYRNVAVEVQKDKSVLGRAAVGGLLFGKTGAILGGMSGVGQKTKKEYKGYLYVSYKQGNSEVERVFEDYPSTSGDKIYKSYQKLR